MGSKKSKHGLITDGAELSDAHLKKIASISKQSKSQIKKWYEKFRAESTTGTLDKHMFVQCVKQLFPDLKDVEQFATNVFASKIRFNYLFYFCIKIIH